MTQTEKFPGIGIKKSSTEYLYNFFINLNKKMYNIFSMIHYIV